jgi:HK97 family phage prohead protease
MPELLAFSRRYGAVLRLIEYMPIGIDEYWTQERFVPIDEAQRRLEATGHRVEPLPDVDKPIGGGPANGGFTETIARGAAAKSAAEADVRLLANHEGLPLARTKSGTLQLESDDIGLKVRATLDPANPAAAEVRSAMERGDVDQMSFAFKVLRDSWDAGYDNRTISEVKLFDVSLVTDPANPATVVKLRSDDAPKSESAAAAKPAGRSVDLAKRQLEAELGRKRV